MNDDMTANLDGLQSALGRRYTVTRELGRGGMGPLITLKQAEKR